MFDPWTIYCPLVRQDVDKCLLPPCVNTPSSSHTGSSCIQQNDIIPDGTLLSITPSYASDFGVCCAACSNTARCNAFAYCQPGSGNCTIPRGTVGAGTYNETSCLLFYQQALELPGNGIKPATFTTNVVVNFVAGAPIAASTLADGNGTVDGYAPYAFARLASDVGVLQTCGSNGNGTCVLDNATLEVGHRVGDGDQGMQGSTTVGWQPTKCNIPHQSNTLYIPLRMQQQLVTTPPIALHSNTSPPLPLLDLLASPHSTPRCNCDLPSTTTYSNPRAQSST